MIARTTTPTALACALALAAAGCAAPRRTASTGVVGYGPGTYRISMSSSSTRTSLADLETAAIRQANDFCANYGRVMAPGDVESVMSPKAYYALTFRCVQRGQ
jgi:hypothetical protein